jgi:hypothetical protein
MQGSFIPLPRTRMERDRASDPRRSIEERYESRAAYLALVSTAADGLVGKGYLLMADVPRILQQAAGRWDHVMSR